MPNWWRWNPATHIFEMSTNEGVNWAPPALNASVINEGVFAAARIPVLPKGNLPASIAYEDESNTFTGVQQMIAATPSVLYFNELAQPLDKKLFRLVGSGQTFQIQAANDSGGLVNTPLIIDRTANATFGAHIYTKNGTGYLYPGRADIADGAIQTSYLLASHGSFGLYTNTGIYVTLNVTCASHIVSGGDHYERSRVLPMGHWQDVPFSATNFTTSGGLTWTVGAGAILRNKFALIGKTMIWSIYLSWYSGSNTLAGSPAAYIQIAAPGGLAMASYQTNPITYFAGVSGLSGAAPMATGYMNSAGAAIQIYKFNNGNFVAGDVPGIIATTVWELT